MTAWVALHGLGNRVHAVRGRLARSQRATDVKSNEITAIPKHLKLLDIQGAVETIDAMGTQSKIAEQILEQGGDFVLALKGEHSAVHRAQL